MMLEWIQDSQSVLPLVGFLGAALVLAVLFFVFRKLLKLIIALCVLAIGVLLSLQYGEFDVADRFRHWMAAGKETVTELPASEAVDEVLVPLIGDALPESVEAAVDAAEETVRDNLRDVDPGGR